MKRPGIKDLAKMLSLNPSTVSRALSDHPDIKPETRERVKAAASEFNYQPNLHARFFRKKSSGLFALILPEWGMFFIPGLMDGINEGLLHSGFSLIVFFSNNSLEREKEIVNHCLSWVVDGVLISLSENTHNLDHLQSFKSADIPLVMLDRVLYSPDFSTVTIDDEQAAFQATEHLIKHDKKNILGLFGNINLEITKQRAKGFKACLDHYQVGYSDYDLVFIDKISGDKALETKLRNTPYNGIFIMSDELLMTTYPLLMKNRQFPGQISVVAISDGKIPYQLFPKITHIQHSGFEVGKAATILLINNIKNKTGDQQNLQVSTRLIELDSVQN
jgi:LacI family transcriptional regulator